jgi:peroxiredoxin
LLNKYSAQGLKVIAINADEEESLTPQTVAEFAEWLGLTLPIAVEVPGQGTYAEIVSAYQGTDPVPVNIVIDKQGVIRYVAREYDPDALEVMVQQLLAAL